MYPEDDGRARHCNVVQYFIGLETRECVTHNLRRERPRSLTIVSKFLTASSTIKIQKFKFEFLMRRISHRNVTLFSEIQAENIRFHNSLDLENDG